MTPITTHKCLYDDLQLSPHHVLSLEPLGALSDLEFNLIALCQRLESVSLDRGKMNEYVLAPVLLDKSEALAVVKPLHCSFWQLSSPPFYVYLCSCAPDKDDGK
tara:strand:- start:295 stop:606 length:312 start_codon:yes stop_codon:yes gene_type:complete